MTKFLLLIGLVLTVCWIWRKSQTTRNGDAPQSFKRDAEPMVECARCGVNQPVSESILVEGRYYCCAAHLPKARPDGV